MPLARIITRTPQDATAASDYLLSQGYTVETVSPEEFRITPAELELDLGRCRPGEAVARAKALVESQPMAGQEQTEEAAAPEPAQPQPAKIPVAYDITGRPVEFEDQKETARRQEPNSMGRALASMLAALAGAWQSVESPVRGLQRKRALKLEAELAREREETRRDEEAELAERRRQEQTAAEHQVEQERARVAALHEAMIAAERETAPQRQPQQVDPPAPAPEVAAEVRQLPPHRSPARARPLLERRERAHMVIWRRAVATAFGASLMLLLGFIAYANRRPASPLSPGALMKNELVRQDVPFGAATITAAPVAVVPKPRASVPVKASPALRPATRKPSAGRRSAQPLRRPSRDDSPAEDEVVVRRSPAPRPKLQPSTATLKRHSDVD